MRILESIFYYLHGENEKEGRPISYDTTSGNMIISLCLIMLPIGFLFWILLFFPNALDVFEDILGDIFGRKSGRLIGQSSVTILFLSIFPIVKKTIGTQKNYERILELYLNMSSDEQQKVAKKGRNFFGFSLLFFGLPIFIYSILTAFA